MPTQSLEFPISESAALTVLVSDGDANRFARLFKQAYAKLPKRVQDRIQDHWRSQICSPEITLEGDPCLVANDGEGHALSITEDEGHKIRFSGPAFDWLATVKGEEVAVSMIVHELGHVLSWAERRLGVLPRKEEDAYKRALAGDQTAIAVLEELVDARMEKWGVDPKPIRDATADFIKIIESAIRKTMQRQTKDTPEE